MNRRLWPPLLAVGAIVLASVLVPVLGLPDPVRMDVAARLAGPSLAHPLGRDEYGRDELSRLVWGARTSLTVALASSVLAGVAGTALGLLGGYFRSLAEVFLLRGADVILCFPPVLLALLVVTLVGPGVGTLIFVLFVLYLPSFIRVAYAGALSVRSHEYVEAVRALGAGSTRIMLRTILPNIGGPVLVQASLCVASAIILEAGLSFLGAGVVPPTSSWGLMIAGARPVMDQAPLVLLWPCLALSLTILAVNALCDALRDAVAPERARLHGMRRAVEMLLPGMVPAHSGASVLEVAGLTVEIETPGGTIRPVRDVSLHVDAGETLAIVGESGSGKTLTGMALMGLLPPGARAAAGSALFAGADLLRMREAERRRLRGGALAMVFQDPMSSLNPVQRVGEQVAEAVSAHRAISAEAAAERAVTLLRRVGIPDPQARARAYPHELSGGMRQRVMIAMAVANEPRLVIADEPTTALDVTIQAQILELLAELQRESRLALVFITHSLPVVAEIADRVAVMYAGEIVEQGRVGEVFARPLHPYTAALLASAPRDECPPPAGIPGMVPSPSALPPGCAFAPRCAHRIDACVSAAPPVAEAAEGRATRCIRWKALAA